MTDPALAQRLDELETRLTFVDDTVNALSAADAGQALRLATIERLLRELRGDLETLRLGQAADPHSEPPPPHY